MHKRKFMDGRMTPRELWRHVVMGGRVCAGCGGKGVVIRCRVLVPAADVQAQVNPAVLELLGARDPTAILQASVMLTDGKPYVCISETLACHKCKDTMRAAARKAPSWAVVEFDEGPEEQKLQMKLH